MSLDQAPLESRENSSILRVSKDLLAGSFGGLLQVFVGQPFDTAKVRMQTNPGGAGMLHVAREILRNEGLHGFYKGTLSPLMGISATVSVQFGTNELMKRIMTSININSQRPDPETLSLPQLALCGHVSGLANAFVGAPVEHIRIRMQMQRDKVGAYTGSIDAYRKIYREYGIRGVYKGMGATLARDGVALCVYFTSYEVYLRALLPANADRTQMSMAYPLLAGGVSGLTTWICALPFDVVKTRVQTDHFVGGQHSSFGRVVRSILREEGLRSFTLGIGPCLMRAVAVNAATFGGFELMKRMLE